ncbi:MAG: serine--tRNA ligase [Proteobacteria bacterium]|nr:serine--tRNA ligase [Pseudomonadota bacterium]
MHDIRYIRDNAAAFDAALDARGLAPLAAELIALDEKRRAAIATAETALARRNAASKEIGQAMGQKDMARAEALKAEVAALKDNIAAGEAEQGRSQKDLDDRLAIIPNMPLTTVPRGKDETDNVEVRRWGTPRALDFAPKQHFELGEALGMMDFDAAGRMSGARFVVLKGALARLERALGQFMLNLHTGEHGYTEIQAPLLVKDEATYGVGQLPKFSEDMFRTENGFWLIPTSEVSMTNLVMGQIVDEAELPYRFTGLTPCFRSEAGSAGRDTRGMLRQHQFNKVEMVSITTPEQSLDEHARMTRCAETVLERLGVPYRTVELCTGDMGFASQRTYDIEAWLPGQGTYREISSCSVCGDFQARRMNARSKAKDAKGTRFVHTLNGSGVAVGRALIAVMENYQNADGSISVPEVLQPYMGGVTRITR